MAWTPNNYYVLVITIMVILGAISAGFYLVAEQRKPEKERASIGRRAMWFFVIWFSFIAVGGLGILIYAIWNRKPDVPMSVFTEEDFKNLDGARKVIVDYSNKMNSLPVVNPGAIFCGTEQCLPTTWVPRAQQRPPPPAEPPSARAGFPGPVPPASPIAQAERARFGGVGMGVPGAPGWLRRPLGGENVPLRGQGGGGAPVVPVLPPAPPQATGVFPAQGRQPRNFRTGMPTTQAQVLQQNLARQDLPRRGAVFSGVESPPLGRPGLGGEPTTARRNLGPVFQGMASENPT